MDGRKTPLPDMGANRPKSFVIAVLALVVMA